jgi:hypothetical protein
MGGLINCLPELAWNLTPPDPDLPGASITGLSHQHPNKIWSLMEVFCFVHLAWFGFLAVLGFGSVPLMKVLNHPQGHPELTLCPPVLSVCVTVSECLHEGQGWSPRLWPHLPPS